jgi:light-regulated signal transduction histidine kinase (bacteriophytochrome)
MADRDKKKHLEELLQAINHDLRTPLANIRSATAILLQDLSDPLTDEQRAFVEIIDQATTRLLDQSNRLMLFNHIAFAQTSLKPIQLSELLAYVKKEIKNSYDIDTIELTTDGDPLLSCHTHTLAATLALLAAGDTKHQPDTPSEKTPAIHCQTVGDQLCFTIQPSQESSASLTALTSEIVQQQGGRLEVVELDGRKQFSFCLPLPDHNK